MRGGPAALLLRALPLLASAALADFTWQSQGADASHSSCVRAAIPSSRTGIQVLGRAAPSGAGAPGALRAPAVSSRGDATTVVAGAAGCLVYFLDAAFAEAGAWSACAPGAALAAAPALDPRGRWALLATTDGTAYALDALAASAGTPLWQVALPEAPAAPALALNDSAWWAGGAAGTLARVTTSMGTLATAPLPPSPQCSSSVNMSVAAPLVALPPPADASDPAAVAAVVTAHGCIVALRDDVSEAWRLDVAPGFAAVGRGSGEVTLPPAVDIETGLLFVLADGGGLCCVVLPTSAGAGTPAPCTSWSASGCIALPTAAAGRMSGGLAVAPSAGFTQRQLFALDAAGVIYSVDVDSGTIMVSTLPGVPGASAPVLVVLGLDSRFSALLTVGSAGTLQAAYVGLASAGDDDNRPSDDDGAGVGAIAWSIAALPLPLPTASAQPPQLRSDAALASMWPWWWQWAATDALLQQPAAAGVTVSAAFAVRSDGRLLLPLSDGTLLVVGPQRAAPQPPPLAIVNAVIIGIGALMLVAIVFTLWAAFRHRARRVAAKAADDAAAASAHAAAPHASTPLAALLEEEEEEAASPVKLPPQPISAHGRYTSLQ